MKTILIFASSLLLLAGTQMCGCGNCAVAQETTSNNTISESKTVKLKITGMTCAGCSNHVTQSLKNVDGVTKVDLEYPGDVATIEYDSKKTTPKELIAAIEKINYKAEIVK